MMDAIQRAVPVPQAEVIMHGASGRQILGQRTPLAAGAQNVHHAVDHLADSDAPFAAAGLARRDQRLDMRPFRIGQVAEIRARIGVTIELTILSLGMAIIIGFPAGCMMAYIRGTFGDYVIRLVTIVGITIPSFWLGIVLIYVFFKLAPGFPSIGYVPFREDPLANLTRMILPTVALGLPIIASVSRIVRSTMLDALNQDYIRTARAKGLSEVGVVFGHALRNAAIPAVTNIGIMAGYLFGGAIVVEQVFALPGLGRLILGAIAERNYPLIQAAILVVTGGFVIINFAIDVLYMIIDPRISQR